jgi:hypothetical protein
MPNRLIDRPLARVHTILSRPVGIKTCLFTTYDACDDAESGCVCCQSCTMWPLEHTRVLRSHHTLAALGEPCRSEATWPPTPRVAVPTDSSIVPGKRGSTKPSAGSDREQLPIRISSSRGSPRNRRIIGRRRKLDKIESTGTPRAGHLRLVDSGIVEPANRCCRFFQDFCGTLIGFDGLWR